MIGPNFNLICNNKLIELLIVPQEGAFSNAVEECKLYLDEGDGEMLSSWLLSE